MDGTAKFKRLAFRNLKDTANPRAAEIIDWALSSFPDGKEFLVSSDFLFWFDKTSTAYTCKLSDILVVFKLKSTMIERLVNSDCMAGSISLNERVSKAIKYNADTISFNLTELNQVLEALNG